MTPSRSIDLISKSDVFPNVAQPCSSPRFMTCRPCASSEPAARMRQQYRRGGKEDTGCRSQAAFEVNLKKSLHRRQPNEEMASQRRGSGESWQPLFDLTQIQTRLLAEPAFPAQQNKLNARTSPFSSTIRSGRIHLNTYNNRSLLRAIHRNLHNKAKPGRSFHFCPENDGSTERERWRGQRQRYKRPWR